MWTIERVKMELNKLCAADGIPAISIPVEPNGRLTVTLGRVHFNRYNCMPTCIEFSRKLLNEGTDNDIINVIKHEYVHYFLLIETGEDHGHDRMFKEKCAKIGCTHNKTKNKLEATSAPSSYKYEVWCDNCHKIIGRYSRRCKTINEIEYCSCGRCKRSNLRVVQNW